MAADESTVCGGADSRSAGVINLIQLQTGTDPGHRFYYHSAGTRSPVRGSPILLTLQKKGEGFGATAGLTLGSIIWVSRLLVEHDYVAKKLRARHSTGLFSLLIVHTKNLEMT